MNNLISNTITNFQKTPLPKEIKKEHDLLPNINTK